MTIPLPLQRLPHGEGLPEPRYMTPGSVGMDLCAAVEETVMLTASQHALVPTGFMIAVPQGFEAQIRSRSGLAAKHQVTVLNSPGTIDQDYRGEVKVILKNQGDTPFEITRGMRIAQMIIAPIARVTLSLQETLPPMPTSTRQAGGFGSTGT